MTADEQLVDEILGQMDRRSLKLDEQETTFTQTADDRSVWRVFTNDPVWINRLVKKGATLIRIDEYGAAFALEENQIRVFQPITDAQREHGRKLAAKKAAQRQE